MLPSGFHVTALTALECPVSVDSHSKVPAEPNDQTLTVLSQLPVASLLPSLFHATDVTTFECPLNVDWHLPVDVPVDVSQSLTILSMLPLANFVPYGPHATEVTLRLR